MRALTFQTIDSASASARSKKKKKIFEKTPGGGGGALRPGSLGDRTIILAWLDLRIHAAGTRARV